MPWGWYISADFQLFLLLPLLAWIFSTNKTAGTAVTLLLIVGGLVLSFVLAYNQDVLAYILPHLYPYNTADLNDLETYLEYSYFYTYTRMACYYLGVLFGCHYFTYKKELAAGEDESMLHRIK
jgi:hypothetical protein